MKTKVSLWRIVLLVLTGIVIGSALYQWNAKTVAGDQMPMPLGFGGSVVLSGSMEPALSVDDLVIVKNTRQFAPGDVIVFQSGNDLIIHRVVSIQDDTIITKGDANDVADDPISIQAVKGVMVCAIPKVGAAVDILQQPAVAILILLAAFGLTELSYRREKAKDQTQLEDLKAQIRQLADELNSEN